MSGSPFDPALTAVAPPRAGAPQPGVAPAAAAFGSPLDPALTAVAPAPSAPPTSGQLARSAWNQGGQTLQIQPGAILGIPGTINTHIPIPQRLSHELIFQGRGLHDVGQGIENTARWLGDKLTGQTYKPPAQRPADRIMAAAERQHPWYNYGVKWPTELGASLPLGEGAGMGAGALMDAAGPTLADDAPLWQRALVAAPRSAAMGAAYGVQQPGGTPGVNAALGAASGPLLEGAARAGGAALGFGRDALQALYQKVRPPQLGESAVDSFIARQLADRQLPLSVTPRETVPGVSLPTAVHSGNPDLLALQSAERTGNIGQRFNELVKSNNDAIVKGLRDNLAPNPDSPAVSDVAHQMLLDAQERGRGVVRATYAPFDEAKGGLYLERPPVQKALNEVHSELLPAHREILPAKFDEVRNATGPLHLTNDIEDLKARLGDAIGAAQPRTPASRALMMARDALNRGVDDAAVAKMPSGEIVGDDVKDLWRKANEANKSFRDRFPQGTARDSEARGWLAKRLMGRGEPTKFLTEALTTRGRAEALLDSFEDPGEREQMRQLMRNHYTNRLLWATRQLAPGDADLSADAISRARRNMGPVEETVYTPQERALLDRHVEAARLNGQIVQRLHMGSSETAALQHYQQDAGEHYGAEAIKHIASRINPVLGAVLHMLPAAADTTANQGAIEQRLLSALLDPEVYNKVASAQPAGRSPLAALLGKVPPALYDATGRGAAVAIPRALGPQLTGVR